MTAPIIGPRTIEQLDSTLRATEIRLSEETLKKLDEIFPGPGGEARRPTLGSPNGLEGAKLWRGVASYLSSPASGARRFTMRFPESLCCGMRWDRGEGEKQKAQLFRTLGTVDRRHSRLNMQMVRASLARRRGLHF